MNLIDAKTTATTAVVVLDAEAEHFSDAKSTTFEDSPININTTNKTADKVEPEPVSQESPTGSESTSDSNNTQTQPDTTIETITDKTPEPEPENVSQTKISTSSPSVASPKPDKKDITEQEGEYENIQARGTVPETTETDFTAVAETVAALEPENVAKEEDKEGKSQIETKTQENAENVDATAGAQQKDSLKTEHIVESSGVAAAAAATADSVTEAQPSSDKKQARSNVYENSKRASLLFMMKLPKSIQTFSTSMFTPKRSSTAISNKKSKVEAGEENKDIKESGSSAQPTEHSKSHINTTSEPIANQELAAEDSALSKTEPKSKIKTKKSSGIDIVPEVFGSPDLNLSLSEFGSNTELAGDNTSAAQGSETRGKKRQSSKAERVECANNENSQMTASSYDTQDTGSVLDPSDKKKSKSKSKSKDKRKAKSGFAAISASFLDVQTSFVSSFNSFYEKMVASAAQSMKKPSKKPSKKHSKSQYNEESKGEDADTENKDVAKGQDGDNAEAESKLTNLGQVGISFDPLTFTPEQSAESSKIQTSAIPENGYGIQFTDFDLKIQPRRTL